MKLLIAGFGSIGRRHFRNLLTLGEKDILFLRSHHSTLESDELAGFPVETSIEEALAHLPDAVIVANPTALHLDVAIPAARQGCHLLMEKPVSSSLDRLDELERAQAEGKGQILVGFQYRFHPGLRQAASWLAEGAAGRPLSAFVRWGEYLPGWHPWEDYRRSYSARPDLGGGVVLTLCHPFDYLRWLLGEVTQVSAFTGKLSSLEIDVEDYADVLLRFEAGTAASVHLDYYRQPGEHSLDIACSEGSIRWDNASGAASLYRSDRKDWEQVLPPQGFERNKLFLDEMAHFIQVARGETAPLCSLKDGLRAQEIALAVHRSSSEGRVVPVGAD